MMAGRQPALFCLLSSMWHKMSSCAGWSRRPSDPRKIASCATPAEWCVSLFPLGPEIVLADVHDLFFSGHAAKPQNVIGALEESGR